MVHFETRHLTISPLLSWLLATATDDHTRERCSARKRPLFPPHTAQLLIPSCLSITSFPSSTPRHCTGSHCTQPVMWPYGSLHEPKSRRDTALRLRKLGSDTSLSRYSCHSFHAFLTCLKKGQDDCKMTSTDNTIWNRNWVFRKKSHT